MSKIVRSIKNVANGYSSTQKLVRNATSNDPLGPTTFDMEEIAAATYNTQTEFMEIMDMLDRRLNDKGKYWRHVAKSLTVLDYLVRYGSEKCVLWLKDNLYIIKTLREFIHYDDADNDQGALIRVKARELCALLRDDERLARERQLAKDRFQRERKRGNESQRNRSDPYDVDLQRALELSRETAEEERSRNRNDNGENDDPDLQAALKLSLEEEEMRRLRNLENQNLLDLDDSFQTQYYQQVQVPQQTVQYFQPQQTYAYAQQQPQQQFDMFGNPIQPTAGWQYGQFQSPQFAAQPQIPQYTGFVNSNSEELTPLKTGSNNPFALQEASVQQHHLQQQQPSMYELAQAQDQNPPQSPSFFTQPATEQPKPGSRPDLERKPSRYNDSHELNNLLAQGTGVDTFGNTGATRIPHQHTKTGTFINSSGTGYKNSVYNNTPMSSNATGNPFLNTGIGSATANNLNPRVRLESAPTGYGFGNTKDEPSLIDI